MRHINISVSGRVQGVGFRYAAVRIARSFGIKGFIRNEPDGSVYIEAEGEEAGIKLFLDWCRKGPGYGRVDKVSSTESNPQGFEDFQVRY
jgi:acylphosphatase